jgi:hypothetical protein
MPRIKVRSGDVYQLNLPNNLGYCYVKSINLAEFVAHNQYATIVFCYNIRSLVSLQSLSEITDKELILCPLLISGILPAIKNGSWKFIGNEPINKQDLILPEYKRGEPDDAPKSWYYIPNLDVLEKVESDFESVKHLETFGATGSELVSTKIAMALLQDEGKNIKEYFDLNEFYINYYYNEVTSITPYYKQPQYMRGKAVR